MWSPERRDIVAAAAALLSVASAEWWLACKLFGWAEVAFARPENASALTTVIELAALAVLLPFSPALARAIRALLYSASRSDSGSGTGVTAGQSSARR